MSSWKQRSQVFRSMPQPSLFLFLAGVACLFAAVGVVNDSLSLEISSAPRFTAMVVLTSSSAVLWALFGSLRMIRSLIWLAVAQLVCFVISAHLFPALKRTLAVQQWRTEIAVHSGLTLVFVLSGYLLFILFFRREGARFFSAHTEIELASKIQQRLVPAISMHRDRYEFYGVSSPSGVVGGDLLDVVEGKEIVCAYVADVAGHGVAAGVFMSMIKAAMRTEIQKSSINKDARLLEALNDVLYPLTDSSSYATLAYVLIGSTPQLTFSLAAHLPIFHFRQKSGQVVQHSKQNFPVGMFLGTKFETGQIAVELGDIIAVVTDGITEIFNQQGEELGYGHIEKALVESSLRPLSEIGDQILKRTAAFGEVTDDRTLLLLRYR